MTGSNRSVEKNSEEEKPSPPAKEKKTRRYITWKRVVSLFIILCAACGVAGYGHYRDPGPLLDKSAVVIPQGGISQVAQTLQDHHVLAPGWSSLLFFRAAALVSMRQGHVHAAEFEFPAYASIAHVLSILRHGHPITHSLTIPEGVTAYHIRTVLQKAPALQGDFSDIEEGRVAPQTFFYRWGEKRQSLLTKMQELMSQHLSHAWQERDVQALQETIDTPNKLLILASLIERETSQPEERDHIARVFLNRLKKGMRLQTDPTVIYGVSDGKGSLGRSITRSDLDNDTPYNTYKHAGLPPGPICSPSVASLNAAAHPSSGDDLYFVANGKGGHAFSRSLAEHVQHVRDYRKMKSEP